MPSPFPGMNPYLEQDRVWADFHQAFCTNLRALLVPQVRPDFFVKLEEHVYIHEVTEAQRVLVGRADVAVGEREATRRPDLGSVSTLQAPAEVRIPLTMDVERIPYIEIRTRADQTLVTVIELLSPTNKRQGDDRRNFLAKRGELLRSNVHYVEIDLLRGGPRMPFESAPECDYYVVVGRADQRPALGMWPLGLRDPLPTIPIPLRAPHADAHVDLGAALHHVYDAAGYEDYIYAGQPQPKLREEDEAWARGLLGAGR